MTTLKNLAQTFKTRLQKVENTFEAEAIFNLVCEHMLNMDRLQCLQNQEMKLDEATENQFNAILSRLEKGEPVQYILGEAWFYDLKFEVNPAVLIPRQETEELVHWIWQDYKTSSSPISILDIGTGSGCIPISLKKFLPKANVSACDISKEALQTAQKNAHLNKVEIDFFEANALANPTFPQSEYDVMVSNPPYVTKKEMEEMHSKVLQHEPHLALFVEDHDPLIFYQSIAQLAQKYLSKNGSLYLEINQYLGQEMLNLLEKMNFDAELRKDLNGNDRMIKAVIKKAVH